MKVSIEIDEAKLKELVRDYVNEQLGELAAAVDDIKIETKSKQNYRAEWETASFRATIQISK